MRAVRTLLHDMEWRLKADIELTNEDMQAKFDQQEQTISGKTKERA